MDFKLCAYESPGRSRAHEFGVLSNMFTGYGDVADSKITFCKPPGWSIGSK